MDDVKKILCIYAGGIGGAAASIVATTVLSVATPVALGIGLVVGGTSVIAASCMDD